MSSPSLSQVMIDICDRYQQAAQHLVQAYQNGVERTARNVNTRFAAGLQARSMPLIDESVKSSLIAAAQHLSDATISRAQSTSTALNAANERVAKSVKTGVERAADVVGRVDTAFNSKAVQTMSVLGMPSAQLSLSVANAVADRAQRLEARIVEAEAAVEAAVEVKSAPKKAARATTQD